MRTVTLGEAVDAATAEALADELSNTPGVLFAEPNGIVTLEDVQPTAPWGLDRIDQPALPLDTTYQYQGSSQGAGVTVYVVDTGILASHVDFGGRVASGYDGVGDGKGSSDCNGHGTHVAGTIGGSTYGVAKQATLVPVRVFGCTGGTTIDAVVAGINWATTQHSSGLAVANLSLSAGESVALDTAVTALIADGVTAAVAAGNANVDSCTRSPARVPAALTVNASDIADRRASFSNFGSCSDLYAPGVDILSTWWTSTDATNTISGTSMAAPHVAGAAERILGANTGYSPAQVASAILGAAKAVTFSPASPDPDRLLFADPVATVTPPGAPRNVGAVAGNTSTTVSWDPPVSDGGSLLTGYTARAFEASSGGTPAAACQASPATQETCTISGLTNGIPFYVDVIAANAYFPLTGSPSSRVEVTPVGTPVVPSAPRDVRLTVGNASLTVGWTAPGSNGGATIQLYRAQAFTLAGDSGGFCETVALSCPIAGLANGTTYYDDVFARNSIGPGSASAPRVAATPATTPSVPLNVAATAGENQALVTWSAPSDTGGSSITGYTARAWTAASGGSTAATCQPAVPTGLGCTITSLSGGTTYYVDVVAANAVGTGAAPASRVAVTPTAPPAPPAPPASGGGGGGSSSGSSSGSTGGGDSTWLVKEVRPSSGPAAGGTTALIIGYGFTGATRVTVGGVTAPGFRFINDGTLEIVTPAGTLGWQDLVVWLPSGSAPAGFQYTNGAPAAVSAPSTPAAPTSPTSPAAPTGSVAGTPVGPASSPIVRPTTVLAGQTPVSAVGRAAVTPARAPIVAGEVGDAFKLRVAGLPKSSTVIAQIRIGSRYYALGKVPTSARGSAVLPAFSAQKDGTYLVKVIPAGGKPRYVKVVVR